MTKSRSATAFRLPPALIDALRLAAEERDVSMNWLVAKALEDFLPRLVPVDEIVWTRRAPDPETEGGE